MLVIDGIGIGTCDVKGVESHFTGSSDKEHQLTDFKGIHEKICGLLIPLRTPVAVLGSEEERAHRSHQTLHRQQQLLELTKTEAHKKLFEGKYNLAIPAALQALRFSIAIHGPDAIELVPSYLLLGEASIGLNQTKQAEDYLSLAKWAVMRCGEVDLEVKAQLHRNFGLLFKAKGMAEGAIEEVALDIYYSSLKSGNPEHISGGYYHLGTLFQSLNRFDDTTSIYDRIIHIYKTYLVTSESLNEAQQAEAVQILKSVLAYRQNYVSSPISAAEALWVFALLWRKVGSNERAREFAGKALEAYEAALGREHSISIEIRAFLKTMVGDSGASSRLLGNRKSCNA
ncbi:hypothetical protein SpCBS45565_g08087 [Spizellomyces sp. 'palustris']|nr:hypothetical protein SpCBS45565_g08087 [Spizellomyces sp. 'palustris']